MHLLRGEGKEGTKVVPAICSQVYAFGWGRYGNLGNGSLEDK